MDYTQAKKLLEKYNQTQLLDYYDELDEQSKKRLLCDIEKLDFSVLENIGSGQERKIGSLSPADALSVEEIDKDREKYEKVGIEAIKSGKVAAVLLAGGQGTRLGSSLPKGMFNIGVNKKLSIFEQQMNNIKQVVNKVGADFHIFVMTSDINHADTCNFFKENDYFGYNPQKIHFYKQKLAPTSSFDGKIYLEEKDKISLSPNGNGGWYSSLIEAGYGDFLRENGIEWLNIYAVDNVLQRICDPVFIGATLKSGCNCSAKVVKKVSPEEKVGVLCMEDGKPAIVEYYEMPQDIASLRRPDGELKFAYGVTLNYLFKVELLNKTIDKTLPVHLSLKKIPYISGGVKVKPEEPNGYKFEYLVLDMIKLMENCLAVEVVREKEFAPVKNRTGVDSVDSARALLAKNGVKL